MCPVVDADICRDGWTDAELRRIRHGSTSAGSARRCSISREPVWGSRQTIHISIKCRTSKSTLKQRGAEQANGAKCLRFPWLSAYALPRADQRHVYSMVYYEQRYVRAAEPYLWFTTPIGRL